MKQILFSKILNENSKEIPLVIFHGLFGMLDNWQSLGILFAEKRSVHLVDLRNHGRSFHSEEMNFKVMANDILDYLTFHSIEKCYLLGHSLGGKAVMEFAFSFPEKVEKLIVADIAPKQYPAHHQAILKALQSVDFSKIERRSQVDEILSKYILEMGVRQFLLKNVFQDDNDLYAFRFNTKVLAKNYSALIGQISNGIFAGPTLFLKGEKSNYIEVSDEFEIKKHFPNAKIETIPNSGHWLHADNPTAFFMHTEKFIS